MQTAYQEGKSCSDHIFFLRCIIEQLNGDKRKFFVTAVDFDLAFDRVKRSTLLRKLILFGASSAFAVCLANLYLVSGNIIYSNSSSIMYMLYAGIKQGLPLSPYLFLFYIDDIFDHFDGIFGNSCFDVFDRLHILIHADDANLLATSKEMMIRKLESLLNYCKKNSILLQASKCWSLVVNGTNDDKSPLIIADNDPVKHAEHLEILGSHISGNVNTDLELHLKKRFIKVINYFNYIKMNRLAPVSVKLTVLNSCVSHALLYNCEAFGPTVPDGLEQVYYKLLKAALGVRSSCPNLLTLIESGCQPLKCMIQARQLKFYRRFKLSLQPNATRAKIFSHLLTTCTKFLQHYVELDRKYPNATDLISEFSNDVKTKIRSRGSNPDVHYKFWIYLQMNPDLKPSPFLDRLDLVGKTLTKFRLGSHSLPIETGRWRRIKREERRCATCGGLGDEKHIVYDCSEIRRDDLPELPRPLSRIWGYAGVNRLFKRILNEKYTE